MASFSAVAPGQGLASPAVAVEKASLSFAGDVVFDNLTFLAEGGRCTCILGPSGCGKSTLLKMISGNTSVPYGGNIHFDDTPACSSMTAWMSQRDLLLPWMSVENNVLLGARLRSQVSEELRTRARDLLLAAGLNEYSGALPGVLSGGMRQRVALLRTLMEERPILLMDEPFSALDALTRIRLQDIAADMTRGKTVLLVTHDPLEALRLGDRILVLAGKPAVVAAQIDPGGAVPRTMDERILGQHYPVLLDTLMGQGDGG